MPPPGGVVAPQRFAVTSLGGFVKDLTTEGVSPNPGPPSTSPMCESRTSCALTDHNKSPQCRFYPTLHSEWLQNAKSLIIAMLDELCDEAEHYGANNVLQLSVELDAALLAAVHTVNHKIQVGGYVRDLTQEGVEPNPGPSHLALVAHTHITLILLLLCVLAGTSEGYDTYVPTTVLSSTMPTATTGYTGVACVYNIGTGLFDPSACPTTNTFASYAGVPGSVATRYTTLTSVYIRCVKNTGVNPYLFTLLGSVDGTVVTVTHSADCSAVSTEIVLSSPYTFTSSIGQKYYVVLTTASGTLQDVQFTFNFMTHLNVTVPSVTDVNIVSVEGVPVGVTSAVTGTLPVSSSLLTPQVVSVAEVFNPVHVFNNETTSPLSVGPRYAPLNLTVSGQFNETDNTMSKICNANPAIPVDEFVYSNCWVYNSCYTDCDISFKPSSDGSIGEVQFRNIGWNLDNHVVLKWEGGGTNGVSNIQCCQGSRCGPSNHAEIVSNRAAHDYGSLEVVELLSSTSDFHPYLYCTVAPLSSYAAEDTIWLSVEFQPTVQSSSLLQVGILPIVTAATDIAANVIPAIINAVKYNEHISDPLKVDVVNQTSTASSEVTVAPYYATSTPGGPPGTWYYPLSTTEQPAIEQKCNFMSYLKGICVKQK